ncbi:MAG: hypothetical protein RIF41_27150 [Polyangiaceae bacterium]
MRPLTFARVFGTACLGVGCASASPAPPPPPPTAVLVPPPVVPVPSAAERAVVVPAPLASPACVFERQQGHLRSSLGFVAGSKRFATLAGEVTVERLEVDGTRAYAVVDDGAVRLAADVAPATVRLGTRDQAPIDGWLELEEAKIVSASPGALTLAPALSSTFVPVQPVVVERRCESLTIFAPVEEASPLGGDYVRLRAGQRVPISATPTGPPIGHLFRAAPQPRPSAVLGALSDTATDFVALDLVRVDERGRHARVRVGGSGDRVLGWVPKDTLEPQAVGLLGMLRGGPDARGPHVRCDRDVTLVVHVDGALHRVGRVHAGASVPIVSGDGRPIALRLSGSPLESLLDAAAGPRPGTTHAVIAAEDAVHCRTGP